MIDRRIRTGDAAIGVRLVGVRPVLVHNVAFDDALERCRFDPHHDADLDVAGLAVADLRYGCLFDGAAARP